MRGFANKHLDKSSNVPVYDFDTDATLERIIRDPMAVLLGRGGLKLQSESRGADPYNRVGRWANSIRR